MRARIQRWLGGMLSPGGKNGRLSILIYHRVLPDADPLRPDEVDAATFSWHMETLSRYFNVLSLSEAVQRLESRSLPDRAACVTFDDGYADNEKVALPILRQWNVPATFFVATGFLNGGRMWNDSIIEAVTRANDTELDLTAMGVGRVETANIEQKLASIGTILTRLKHLPLTDRSERVEQIVDVVGQKLPDDLMMCSAQVRALASAGMEIGGHTVNHPILQSLSNDDARDEIANGKEELEAMTQQRVELFAYPNGRPKQDYDVDHVSIVRELGFKAAVSTAWGVATHQADHYQLPRFTPWDREPSKFFFRILQNSMRRTYASV